MHDGASAQHGGCCRYAFRLGTARVERAGVCVFLTSGPYPDHRRPEVAPRDFHRKPPQLGDGALGSLPGPAGRYPGEEATSCDVRGFVHYWR
jgi:hypothetical protein